MKFKNTFNVFINNFSVTYKLLIYKVIVSIIFVFASIGIIYPVIDSIVANDVFKNLLNSFQGLVGDLVNGNVDNLKTIVGDIKDGFDNLLALITEKQATIILSLIFIILIYLIQNFFQGLGHYVAASLVNDRMAMQAKSPFIGTLIKNLGRASIYNLIYVLVSFLYDTICITAVSYLIFGALVFVPILLRIMLLVTAIIVLLAVKMTFASDWLPAMICGRQSAIKAMLTSVSRKNKSTATTLSYYAVIILLILAINVAAVILTFGAGLFITVPGSFVILNCFQFVNYFSTNDIMYFTDKNTIIKPDREKQISREEFFRGEN